jgi:sarcosine oxidase subunit beta
MIRQHYSTPLLVRLARASIDMLRAMPGEFGQDGGYRAAGYCFLVPADMLDGARRNIAMQQAHGIETAFLSGADTGRHLPDLNPDCVAGVIHEPLGGYADPVRSTEAYVAGFLRDGGELFRHTAARALLREHDRVTGVLTDAGALASGWVVNAAGP